MVLDSKIQKLREHFGIQVPGDWANVLPSSVTAVPDIGEQTLNHLRLHLAGHGLTLKNDQTPAYWQQELSTVRIGTSQISKTDKAILCPFTIVIDVQEKNPFSFTGLMSHAIKGKRRPLIVKTVTASLGPTHGDYSIAGLEGEVHIERKSMEDMRDTTLGWGERRERFEKTLKFLSEIPSSAVVIECTKGQLMLSAESRGKKSVEENRFILQQQTSAWEDDFRVPFKFCDSRLMAMHETFRWLERYWRHHAARQKLAEVKSLSLDSDLSSIF